MNRRLAVLWCMATWLVLGACSGSDTLVAGDGHAHGTSGSLALWGDSGEPDCITDPFGEYGVFNLLVFGNLTQSNTDIQGQVAVGVDATLQDFQAGDAIPLDPLRNDLIVGNDLWFTQGQVLNGGIAYGNTVTLSQVTYAALRHESPLDFGEAGTMLNALSDELVALHGLANGTVEFVNPEQMMYGVVLTGTDPLFNFFELTVEEMSTAYELTIDAPEDSSVLVNVAGTLPDDPLDPLDGVRMVNLGTTLVGLGPEHVVFHFPDATNLTIDSTVVPGTIVAPLADIFFPQGLVSGQIFAHSLVGQGQTNLPLFSGCLPVTPTGDDPCANNVPPTNLLVSVPPCPFVGIPFEIVVSVTHTATGDTLAFDVAGANATIELVTSDELTATFSITPLVPGDYTMVATVSDGCDTVTGPFAFSASTVGGEYLLLPAGTFTMGAPMSEPGRMAGENQHDVTLSSGFYLKTTLVTQGEWMVTYDGWNPSYFDTCGCTCPMYDVTWYDALAYANKRSQAEGFAPCYTFAGVVCGTGGSVGTNYEACMDAAHGGIESATVGLNGGATTPYECEGYRLATEAEWEYAARAGTTLGTYNGDLDPLKLDCNSPNEVLDPIVWHCGNSGTSIHPVKFKQPNPWGLYDMLGNAYEWVWDWFGPYPAGPVVDPTGPATGTKKIGRGGSWNAEASFARASNRRGFDPSGPPFSLREYGEAFRLARTSH